MTINVKKVIRELVADFKRDNPAAATGISAPNAHRRRPTRRLRRPSGRYSNDVIDVPLGCLHCVSGLLGRRTLAVVHHPTCPTKSLDRP